MVHRRIPLVVSSPLRLEPDHRCAAITTRVYTRQHQIAQCFFFASRGSWSIMQILEIPLEGSAEADQPRAVKVGEHSSKVMHDTIRALAEL